MGMTLGLQEAAAKYGIASPFDLSVMGSFVSGQQTWSSTGNPPIGYPAQNVVLDTANGFHWQLSIVFESGTSGNVVSAGVTKGGDLIWTASGEGPIDWANPNLADVFGGDDTVVGNSSNNLFYGDAGNDHVDGRGGTDTVAYAQASTAFTITRSGSDLVVSSSAYGTDTLTNVERLQFADKSIAYDVQGTAGQAYRLYQAALDRAPDAGGLAYYIGKLDGGTSEHDIAIGFINSPEFMSRFGASLTDLQYVQQLYQNVLHRAGEDAGVSYQLNALQSGVVDRAQLLVNFSESPENQAALIGVMQQGMAYAPPVTR